MVSNNILLCRPGQLSSINRIATINLQLPQFAKLAYGTWTAFTLVQCHMDCLLFYTDWVVVDKGSPLGHLTNGLECGGSSCWYK